jgi:nitrite reductase/ring-hydroxylating ferredoxin subunit
MFPDELRSRRSVLAGGVATCAACLLAGCGGAAGRPAGADATTDPGSPALPSGPVDVGPAAHFAADRIDARWAGRGFFVVCRSGRAFAVSARCTHQNVPLDAGPSDIGCPRHGSVFTAEGEVVKAPAQRPLPRHAIRKTPDGRLVVDTAARFEKDRWTDPAAFVLL